MALELERDESSLVVVVHRQGCVDLIGMVLVVEPYVTVADGWTVQRCERCGPEYGLVVRSRREMRFWDQRRIPHRFLEGENKRHDLSRLNVPVMYPRVQHWKREANCRTDGRLGEWLRWLYATDHQRRWAVNVQKHICSECPVRRECLEAGVWGREWGVWGGATLGERQKIRKQWERQGRMDVGGLGSQDGGWDTATG